MEDREIVEWNIQQSKQAIKKSLLKDKIIIFFTRLIEDMRRYNNPNFYGRLKEMFLLIYPYSGEERPKEIYRQIKDSDLKSEEGLSLDKEEISYVRFFLDSLDEQCKLKNRKETEKELENILEKLMKKYLPNSSALIESYLLGKLISSVGGIKNLSRFPSSTIQLIGAEKALFMHISKHRQCPKHGLIFYAGSVRQAENPGKAARQLANKLALSIRVDYFQNAQK